jgi:hypothetical protein
MHADISAIVASPLTSKSILALVSDHLPALAQTTGLLFRSSSRAFTHCSTPVPDDSTHAHLSNSNSNTSMQLQQRSNLQGAGRPHAARKAAVAPIRAHLASARPIACMSHAQVSAGLAGSARWSSIGALPFAASPLQHRSVANNARHHSRAYTCIVVTMYLKL